ncbi:unnamed protein product [Rhizophagus irregularis]|nr:unnamed protein product [Rhizophagus irregularis]
MNGFGGLLKNEKELRFINVLELKSTVSHFLDRIVSASLSQMIGSINRTWTLFFFFSYSETTFNIRSFQDAIM